MTGPAAEARTWEEVLAAVEADAAHAAQLLRPDPVDDVLTAPPVLLPELTQMPSVPEHLRERIETLKAHIDELQQELAAALREWRGPVRPVVAPTAVPIATPHYLDRLV